MFEVVVPNGGTVIKISSLLGLMSIFASVLFFLQTPTEGLQEYVHGTKCFRSLKTRLDYCYKPQVHAEYFWLCRKGEMHILEVFFVTNICTTFYLAVIQ